MSSHRPPTVQHPTSGGTPTGNPETDRRWGVAALRSRDPSVLRVVGGQNHPHHIGLRYLTDPLDHHAQRVIDRPGRNGELGGRGEPRLSSLCTLEQPGILDRETGRGGERCNELFVIRAELA